MAILEQSEHADWLNRFVKPTAAALLVPYAAEVQQAAQSLIAELRARTGRAPVIEWRGVPWRWTLVFHRQGDDEAWAYVVPAPGAPLLAVPIPEDTPSTVASRRLGKPLRDPLDRAPVVGQIRWAEWPVASESVLAELIAFTDAVCDPHSK